jgi:glycerol uptake facilitator-like aquaporin
MTSRARQLAAEFIGTGLLVATVVGSGIMAERLAGGNAAVALLGNTIPTGAILMVLITVFGPLSGAHFNPVVSAVMTAARTLPASLLGPYLLAQVLGGIAGAVLANLMFGMPAVTWSATLRGGMGQWLGEITATAILLMVVLGSIRQAPQATPWLVGLTITAAYCFTSSTSFANPAVTIARMLSDSFAGIAPASVPIFIIMQAVGGAIGALAGLWLFRGARSS